jgi:hypothetical protein
MAVFASTHRHENPVSVIDHRKRSDRPGNGTAKLLLEPRSIFRHDVAA